VAAAWSSASAAGLRLSIDAPTPGAVLASSDGRAFVTGRALGVAGVSGEFDVVVVIDTSYSTSAPSGADVDGDGRRGKRWGAPFIPVLPKLLGFPNTDSGDSVLACEVAATRTLLAQLDPETTRVGVVSFSGDRRDETRDARVEVPLTHRYERVEYGLQRLLDAGPNGQTNIFEAVYLASTELDGDVQALSEPRPGARKIALFMTDGHPNLPVRGSRMGSARYALDAARNVAHEVRIDTFAIGDTATDDPYVTQGMAELTGGVYTPVADPRELVAVFQDINLAAIEDVEIYNRTTGASAAPVMLDADGHYSAFVELADGRNDLVVRARAADGSRGRAGISVQRLPGGSTQALTPRLRARQNRLLEHHLAALKRRRLELELARDDEQLRALALEMEAIRAARSRSLQIAVDE
jgi:hypothetical protein